MILRDVTAGIEILDASGNRDVDVTGITYDSRAVRRGDLFIALRGEHFDGLSFVVDAVRGGAAAVVHEGERVRLPATAEESGVCLLRVRDARDAMARCSCAFFGRPSESLHVVGVTGTNGKTTTTYLVKSILDAWGRKTGLIGTIQYLVGEEASEAIHTTPESPDFQSMLARMLTAGCQFVVTEVSSHALSQKRVDGTVFRTSVFTNLTRDHLDFHAGMEDYFRAKTRLFADLTEPDGTCLINSDDPYGRRLAALLAGTSQGVNVVTYGLQDGADLLASDISDSARGLRFALSYRGRRQTVSSPLMGLPNVYNILAAIGTGTVLGVPWRVMSEGVRNCAAVKGRFERVDAGQNFLALVDYAHTEDALERLIYTARGLSRKKIITVFGCGGDRDKGKRPAMGAIATRLSDFVVLTSDNPRSERAEAIIREIEAGAVRKNYLVEPDRRKAIRRAVLLAEPEDIVLVAGKGHETYQEIGGKRVHFSDREELEQAVREVVIDRSSHHYRRGTGNGT